MDLKDKELTERIIGAAIAVHRHLGPGFLESIYEEALCVELEASGIKHERQKSIALTYRGRPIGEHRLDLLVCGRVVVELKAICALEKAHFAVVRSYMKAVNSDVGLLMNFATMPLTIKRVGREKAELIESGTQELKDRISLPDFLSSKLHSETRGSGDIYFQS